MGLPRDRLEAPPRAIAPMLAVQMLLGGPGTQLGWFFLVIGTFVFWLFACHADLTGWRFREGSIATVRGTALDCRDTRYSVGGTRMSRGTPVFENHYAYTVDGTPFDARSWATGDCRSRGSVTVEYLLADPAYSRIRGMRHRLLSPWAMLGAAVPVGAFAIVIVGFRKGMVRLHLLREGEPAVGRVIAKTPTGSRTMGHPVYRVTVEFIAPDGSTRATTVKTTEPERLGAEKQESVLYDRANPNCALPIEGMPGQLTLDHAGRIVPDYNRALLFLPTLVLLLNAWFVWRSL